MPVRVVLAVVVLALTSACGTPTGSPVPVGSGPVCPVEPVAVVVSVDPWSDLVERLGGACARVDTVLAGSSADPHEYEPSIGDAATMSGAELAVINGAGYDAWAGRLLETLDPAPVVVDAGEVLGVAEGSNPHLWYSPTYVHEVVAAVTAGLTQVRPEAAEYLAARAADVATYLAEYDAAVGELADSAAGRSYAATEGVYDLMATALGLRDETPAGWRQAAANESDPSPADVAAFQAALAEGRVEVLVRNVQTEGSTTDLVTGAALDAAVAVVDVTETLPAGQSSFVAWQVGQLARLASALERR